MAIITFEETNTTEYWSHQNPTFQLFCSLYRFTFLDSLSWHSLHLPLMPPEGDEEYHPDGLKSNAEEKKRMQKETPKHCMKILRSTKQDRNFLSRILSALQRFWPIAFLIFIMLPRHGVSYEIDPDCTVWHRNQNDTTLDANDVRSLTSERGFFNGSNRHYNKICPNAFAHAPVKHVDLSHNNLTSLPGNLFWGVTNLEIAELQGNPLTKFPPALNNTRTVKFLNLAGTNITDIPKYTINGMMKLNALNLSRTGITSVPTDVFDLPDIYVIHLCYSKLSRLPLPPASSIAFSVLLRGEDNANELLLSHPDSGKRQIGIYIAGIETLTCENAKAAIESSYCVLAGKIVCDHGSFKEINIRLKGKSKFSPSCLPEQNANGTYITVANELNGKVSPRTFLLNRGSATPWSNLIEDSSSLWHVGIIISVIIIVAIVGVVAAIWVKRNYLTPSTRGETSLPLQ